MQVQDKSVTQNQMQVQDNSVTQNQTQKFEINSNASDLDQEFALWCIQRLQLNGEKIWR